MYFSSGAREAVLVAQIAYQIYGTYKKSPQQFQALAREALTLETALKTAVDEAEKTFPNDQPSTQYQTRLAYLAVGAKDLLKELDALLKKYDSLATNKYSTWDRLLFGKEDVETLRARMAFHVAAIHGFQTDMIKLRTNDIGYVYISPFHAVEMRADGQTNSAEVKQILEILVQSKSREAATASSQWREANTEDLYEALEKKGVSHEFMMQNKTVIVDLIVDAVKKQELARQQSTPDDSRLFEYSIGGDVLEERTPGEENTRTCACKVECVGECLYLNWSPSLTFTDWNGPTAVGSPTDQSPLEGGKEVKESILQAVSKKLQQIGSSSTAHDGISFQSPPSDKLPRISTDSRSSRDTRTSSDESFRGSISLTPAAGLYSEKGSQRKGSKTLSVEITPTRRKRSRSSTPSLAPSPPLKIPNLLSGLSKFASGIGQSSYSLAEKTGR